MDNKKIAENLIRDKITYISEEGLVDSNTGELLLGNSREIKLDKVPFKIGSMNTIEAKQSRYTKSFHSEDVDFSKNSYYKIWTRVITRLEKFTNRIVKHTESGAENIPLTIDDIIKITGFKKSLIHEFFKECNNKNIIKKLNEYGYVVNPIYVLNGNHITPSLFVLFNKDRVLEKHIPMKYLKFIKMAIKL